MDLELCDICPYGISHEPWCGYNGCTQLSMEGLEFSNEEYNYQWACHVGMDWWDIPE